VVGVAMHHMLDAARGAAAAASRREPAPGRHGVGSMWW
jgi:hypothetical protein